VASVNYGEVPADAERALAGSCPIVASYGARGPMGAGPPRYLAGPAFRFLTRRC
jgi:carboxymethylenebutenolidase